MTSATKSIVVTCIKLGVGAIAGIGTELLINKASKNVIDGHPCNKLQKCEMAFAGAVIGSMVGAAATNFVGEQIDNFMASIDAIGDVSKMIKEAKNEEEEAN